MYSEELEELIDITLADGVLSEKEINVLRKRAQKEGIDTDEFEVYLEGKLMRMKKEAKPFAPSMPPIPSSTAKAQPQKATAAMTPPPTHKVTVKKGTLSRCPACGEIVKDGLQVCKSCGYAFSGITEQNAVMTLNAQIMAAGNENTPECAARRATVIASFPPPTTRGNLLEILAYSKINADRFDPKSGYNYISNSICPGYAYWMLFSTCVETARISFSSDQAFTPFFEWHSTQTQRGQTLKEGLFSTTNFIFKYTKKFFSTSVGKMFGVLMLPIIMLIILGLLAEIIT